MSEVRIFLGAPLKQHSFVSRSERTPSEGLDAATPATPPWHGAMGLALAEAAEAAEGSDVPVGAVLLDEGGLVLAAAGNRRERDGDPTAHAEVLVLRQAAGLARHWRLEGTTLVVTLEPCVMCAGALVNARVRRVVFGALDPKAGALRSLYRLAEDPRLNHRLEIIEGVRADECADLLRGFFRRLRAEGQK
ncbi:MAG TPA: nucleoside deaminase [Polyangiaceae bacterium]|nr:nucleoside deaminase [Polyangiaceae bacterium]